VAFGPLNVQVPSVAMSRLGRAFTQDECNRAYLDAMARMGPRPGVSWARPIWLSPVPVPGPFVDPAPGGGLAAEVARNEATVRRMVLGTNDGSFAPAMLGVLSAHLRGHDLSGAGRGGRSEASGYYEDLLGTTAMALGGCRF